MADNSLKKISKKPTNCVFFPLSNLYLCYRRAIVFVVECAAILPKINLSSLLTWLFVSLPLSVFLLICYEYALGMKQKERKEEEGERRDTKKGERRAEKGE